MLVIDDEPEHRLMLRTILAQEAPGLHVLEAADGREGLLRRRGTRGPLLILCDQRMPLLQGHQVFLCLQGRRRDDERWVVLSSDVSGGQSSVLAAAGVDEVFVKPVAWSDMVAIVRRLVKEWPPGPGTPAGV